jgi:hypothetical protein
MIGIGIANSLGVNLSGINPAAKSFVSATGISSPNEVKAINDLVNGLQADGIWSKMRAIYPFVTDQRNLASFSESFTNGLGWGVSGMTRSENVTTAPNGTLTADRITTSANANNVIFSESSFPSSGATYTNSVYLKYNNAQWVTLEIWTGTAQNGIRLWVDIQNGVLGTADATTGTYVTSSITNVGDGWYRVSITGVVNSGTYPYVGIRHVDGNGAYNFTAVSGKSTFVWGAQSEIGSLTDYQPQLGSAQAVISSQFKFNLVNPLDTDAAFRLVFNGGWTHSTLGATPNGTNGFADTKLAPNAMSQNSAHISIYNRTDSAGNFTDIGCTTASSSGNDFQLISRYTGNLNYSTLNTNLVLGFSNSSSIGLKTITRNSSTQMGFFNNTTKTTITQASVAPNSIPITIAARNVNNASRELFSNRPCSFASIGDGLTDTEAANLYTRVQAFQTALNRQV